jgi:hypothetical protein
MPRALAWIIAAVAVVVVALGGLAVAVAVITPNRPRERSTRSSRT